MGRASLLALLLGVVSASCGQHLTVVDASSLAPLEGAVLTGERPGATAITDARGRAPLAPFAGQSLLKVAHLGYRGATINLAGADGGTVRLQPAPIGLAEVVVAANRFEEKRRDVPEQVDVIGQREIALLDQQTTPDLLQNSGALFVQRSQMGGGSPVIRGFEASRVLLVVDGVRLNNAIYRAGHLQDLMTIDQNAIDRIEVISGPGSVMYGSDALGGVVHLVTRQPRFRDTTGLGVQGAALLRHSTANGERTASATVELRGRRAASLTTITASDFGDLRTGSVRDARYGDWGLKPFVVRTVNGRDTVERNADPLIQTPTAYRQLDALQKLRLRTGPLMHTLNAQLSTSSDVPRYDRLSEYRVDTLGRYLPAQSQWYYGPQKRLLLAYALEAERRSGAFTRMRLMPSGQRIEQSRHTRGFGSSWLAHRTEQVQVLGLNADLEKRFGRHELRYGAEAVRNTVSSEAHREHIRTGEVTYLTTRYPNGGSTMSSYAAYVSHTAELGPHWVLSAGARLSHVALEARFADDRAYQFLNGTWTQRNTAFNWRVGAVFMPGHAWRITALASTGFRSPNVDDLAKVFDSAPGTVIVPNPALRPERTLNLEIGASKAIAERLHAEATAFHVFFTDALVVGGFTAGGRDSILYDGVLSRVTALRNEREAYVQGAQGRLRWSITEQLLLSSGVTWTYGRVRTDSVDRPLDHVPPTYGRAALRWSGKRLQAEAYVLFNGWKRLKDTDAAPGSEDNLQYATPDGTPAWHTWNVRAAFAINAHLQLQAGLENIADAHYRTFSSGVSAPGRNAQVSLRVRW